MVHGGWGARGLICVKAPALLLPFLYRFADILVVIDLHTFPFIHIAHLLALYHQRSMKTQLYS
jgi:hypothetical protein